MNILNYINGTTLIEVMGKQNIKKVHPRLPYWQIRGNIFNVRDLIKRKKMLLNRILHDFPEPFLWFEDSPVANSLSGTWVEVAQYTWKIPQNVVHDELYTFLNIGEWHIYVSPSEPIELDMSKYNINNYKGIFNFMNDKAIAMLLLAFADNNPWFFGVNDTIMNSD